MIKRTLESSLKKSLKSGKVTILYGARQTGKTTLSKRIMSNYSNPYYMNCDLLSVIEQLRPDSIERLKQLTAEYDLLVIDEAQKSPDIGLTLKIFHDQIPTLPILATGSSSLDLANKIKEPLTGRSNELILYPLSVKEMYPSRIDLDSSIEQTLIYGSYPEIFTSSITKKQGYLRKLADGYIYKDVFNHSTVFDQYLLQNILKLLAYQIGSEVSYNKIANELNSSKNTIIRYIDLLEKAFIVFRVNQFRNNMRKEVGRLRKVYFYDLGVRNGLIDNFNPLISRIDKGALWENFMMTERIKKHQRESVYARNYYWRSDRGQEIDLIEESSGVITAFEFKFGKEITAVPKTFSGANPKTIFKCINRNSYLDFIF